MLKRILKYLSIAIACFLLLTVVTALAYRAYQQHSLTTARAIAVPPGIDTLDRVRIGGIDQWIHVRGRNVNNPVLLFIHGGPGFAFIPMAREFQRPWETYFTVAQWDQRGAGKTYASNDRELQRRTMTVPRMEQDTFEVANYLRTRFGRGRIFVIGHSWGSVLGLWLAHEHPEVLYAYIGTGQLINEQRNTELAYQDAFAAARDRGNQQALKELESIASDPAKGTRIAQYWEAQLLGPSAGERFMEVGNILGTVVSAPEYSLVDDFGFIRGQRLSFEALLPQVADVDLIRLGPDFRVPVYFFEGRRDAFCRPSLVERYVQTMHGPEKEIVWFENSGHFPFFDEREKFAAELARIAHIPAPTSARESLDNPDIYFHNATIAEAKYPEEPVR